jgi:hypothetical protein
MDRLTRGSWIMVAGGCALLLAMAAQAADKLTVRDAGSNVKFVVQDTGKTGVVVANPLYSLDVSAGGLAKSMLHFSKNGTDAGGWLTSAADNQFFVSSGAYFDLTAGGWIQKSGDGLAVMAGSGVAGYRVLTASGGALNSVITPVARLHIDFSGNFGLNTAAVAGVPISTASGAILSAGGAWLNSSSRERKENIQALSGAQALQALAELSPVTYNYKVDAAEKHVGFIAEDVPELVATKDRKSLSALDIVAVLTKAVQEQQQQLAAKSAQLEQQQQTMTDLAATVARLAAELNGLKSRDVSAQR